MHRQPWAPGPTNPAYIELEDQNGTKVDLATKLMRTTSVSCRGDPQARSSLGWMG